MGRASSSNNSSPGIDMDRASSSNDSSPDHDQSDGEREGNVESQIALDEGLARSLQELEYQLGGTSFCETTRNESVPSPSSSVNRECNSTDTPAVAVRQDNIDPDNMTYEELQLLGEEIGTHDRGLSEEVIAYLPSYKYKTGFFSRNDKHEECVICYMAYKNKDIVITLPCKHEYHSNCVTRWLKINKACPVCNEEVFGS
eukprot:TRINITY_DN889_c0_g1_i2.p1 TRINITY_DN889_c0_g1~~TRINITY_DN889_c0_g1_i2.p1  ORF type:complete len:200 (-),score=43.97 TRINITY_DN889_c0_g1_i2:353-952(-)